MSGIAATRSKPAARRRLEIDILGRKEENQMEQASNVALSMLQAVASQAQLPKTGKGDVDSEFQKLIEKAQSGQPDSEIQERPKAEKPANAKKPEKAPAQKKPQDSTEEAVQQGAYVVVGQMPPDAVVELVTLKTPETGEAIAIGMVEGWNGQISASAVGPEEIAGETGWTGAQPLDVSDPKADVILEATAPGADNSPAAMLEKVVAGQTGQEIQPETGEPQPQQQEDGAPEMELLDVEQAPQRIFHDVEAAPVKVGEVYDAQQTEGPNVVKQLDAQINQAMQDGESLVRIQLTPENLGSVTVEITRSAEGLIRVALGAHSAETRGLLERHAGDLQGMLSSRGQEVQVDVQRQAESQQNQNQQHSYDGHNGHAQDGQERRQQRREHTSSPQDFMQQLRLGLIPMDGEDI